VYEALRAVTARRGRSIYDVIVDSVASELDPETRINIYTKLSEKYFRDAEELYRKGEAAQAGEKYWGAVAALLSAIAEAKKLPHYTHRDLWDVVETIVEETKNPEYSTLFSLAERLHANFYHNFMKRESFEKHREGVLKLIEMLRRYLQTLRSAARSS